MEEKSTKQKVTDLQNKDKGVWWKKERQKEKRAESDLFVFHKALSGSLLIRCLALQSELLLAIPPVAQLHPSCHPQTSPSFFASPLLPVMVSA